jgi:SAM-dependent MidA family methyltransferase
MDINPSIEEASHSQTLARLIQKEIQAQNGQVSFAKYMEMALYAPGLGYYAAGKNKLGSKGDFTTAPEISPLFGATIVQTLLPIIEYFQNLNLPVKILEFGAGTGALAESILTELQSQDIEVDSYSILDLSADLIERQQSRLAQPFPVVNWINQLPKNFTGIILANEVLDAMPIELITYQDQQWVFKDVTLAKGSTEDASEDTIGFKHCLGKEVPQAMLPECLRQQSFENGYTTEINVNAKAWMNSISEILDMGILLTVDYGFPEHEYYHQQRNQGTVMGHYAHHAVQDPFFYPGLCDLTAHVDWTSIANTGINSGLSLLGFTSQASYLLDAGIGSLLMEKVDPSNSAEFMPHSNAIQKLLSEAEMGELFKVMCFGKNLPFEEGDLPGFRSRPRSL